MDCGPSPSRAGQPIDPTGITSQNGATVAAWAAIGQATWALLRRSWPLILATWSEIDAFVKKHPDIPLKVRENLDKWRSGFVAAQRKRSAGARIRATLGVVEGLADERVAGVDPSEEAETLVAGWRKRAAAITQALELAERQQGAVRKRMLERVTARTDALAAEAFESLMPDETD